MVKLGDLFIGNFPVTQWFGENFKLSNGNWAYSAEGHMGIDFGCPANTPLVAACNGEIIRVGDKGDGYGVTVQILDYENKQSVLYGHMARATVAVGERVWQGKLVGYSDNSGFSTGNHLHVGVCETDANGIRIKNQEYRNGKLYRRSDGWIDFAGCFSQVRNLGAPVAEDPAVVAQRAADAVRAAAEAQRIADEQAAAAKVEADKRAADEAQRIADEAAAVKAAADAEAIRLAQEQLEADAKAKELAEKTDGTPFKDDTTPVGEPPKHAEDLTLPKLPDGIDYSKGLFKFFKDLFEALLNIANLWKGGK